MRWSRLRALLPLSLLVAAGAYALLPAIPPGEDPDRLVLAAAQVDRPRPGLEVVSAVVRTGAERRGRLVAVYAEPGAVRPGLELNPRLEALDAFLTDAFAVGNAGYFTPEHKPTGLLASAGRVLHPFVRRAGGAGSGVLVVRDGRVELVERDAVPDPPAFEGVELAIQAGPRIIEPDGSPGIRSNDGVRANRTVIGRDQRGWLAFAVVHDGDAGVAHGPTLFELQDLLGATGLGAIAPELAFSAALNLDGGPSTGLHIRDPGPRVDLPAGSRVVSVLTLALRATPP